jgi:hypothetical protein
MSFMRVQGSDTKNDKAADTGTYGPAFYLVGGFVAVSLIAAVLGAGLGWSAFAGACGGALAYYGSID